MIEVEVLGVRLELPNNQPIVLLKEFGGQRHVPIWIGAAEATAISMAYEGIVPPRPQTHDLLIDVLTASGRALTQVAVTALSDGVFYAQLTLDDGTVVPARASDAIALALRAHARLWCAPEVLDEAGVLVAEESGEALSETQTLDSAGGDDAPADPREQEIQMRQFREFLENIDPEDFSS